MRKGTKKILTCLAIGILVVGGIGIWVYVQRQPGRYDAFASCLKNKGATFYGAFWCPHCQKQKAIFGKSATYLPYVECSTPDGRGKLPVCVEKKVEGYPTWEFADGSRLVGEIALSQLAEKTSCQLPQ
jgi:hypothetical protein